MSSETKYPEENTPADEKENFQERFCSGTFKADVLSEDGFKLLEEKGLIYPTQG